MIPGAGVADTARAAGVSQRFSTPATGYSACEGGWFVNGRMPRN